MNRGAKICLFLRLAPLGEGSPHAAPGAACMRPSRTGCKQIFRTMQEKQILISINGRNHSVPCLSRVINKIMKSTTKSKGVFVERELFLYASNVVFRMRVLQKHPSRNIGSQTQYPWYYVSHDSFEKHGCAGITWQPGNRDEYAKNLERVMNLHCLRQIERMTKRKQYSSDVRDENGRLEDRSETRSPAPPPCLPVLCWQIMKWAGCIKNRSKSNGAKIPFCARSTRTYCY